MGGSRTGSERGNSIMTARRVHRAIRQGQQNAGTRKLSARLDREDQSQISDMQPQLNNIVPVHASIRRSSKHLLVVLPSTPWLRTIGGLSHDDVGFRREGT